MGMLTVYPHLVSLLAILEYSALLLVLVVTGQSCWQLSRVKFIGIEC